MLRIGDLILLACKIVFVKSKRLHWGWHAAGHLRKDPPKRIDFLMSSLEPVSAELAMGKIAGGMRYSDHLGVQTVFEYNATTQQKRYFSLVSPCVYWVPAGNTGDLASAPSMSQRKYL